MAPVLFLLAAILFLTADHLLTLRELEKSYKRIRAKLMGDNDKRSGR
jgi:hypothetical protein